MNIKVRNMNIQLHLVLMGCDMSHIGITDVLSILRKYFTTYDLHLNALGKRMLVHLISKRVTEGCMQSINSIPVITYARASPFFFSVNLKAHRCLTYINYCPPESDIHKQNSEIV
jgi:hypothetical protein